MRFTTTLFLLISLWIGLTGQAQTGSTEKSKSPIQPVSTKAHELETDWLNKMSQLERVAPQSFFEGFSKLKIKKINDPSLQKVGEIISSYEDLLTEYHKNKKANPQFDASQILLKRIIKWTLDTIAMGAPYETLDSFYDLIWSESEMDYPKLIREMVSKNKDLSKSDLKFFYQRMDEQQKNLQSF